MREEHPTPDRAAADDCWTRVTVLELERRPDGDWRATQTGTETVGRGPTAAADAASYCLLVDYGLRDGVGDARGRREGEASRPRPESDDRARSGSGPSPADPLPAADGNG